VKSKQSPSLRFSAFHSQGNPFRLGLQNKLVLWLACLVRDWHGGDWIIGRIATADALTNPHLLVIENRPFRKAVGARARSPGIGDRVTFTGMVHRDAVHTYSAAFNIIF